MCKGLQSLVGEREKQPRQRHKLTYSAIYGNLTGPPRYYAKRGKSERERQGL